MDGEAQTNEVKAEEATPPKLDAQVQQANDYLRPVLQTMFNGVMVSSQAWCPPDKMLASMCYAFGVVVGNTTSAGGLSLALRIRHICQNAFEQGMRSVTPKLPPPPPPSAGSRLTSDANGRVK